LNDASEGVASQIGNVGLDSEEVQVINALDTGERGGSDPKQVNPRTFSKTMQD